MRRGHLLPGHRRSLRRVGHSALGFHHPRGERQRGGHGHRLLQVSLHTACAPPVWLRLPDTCPLPLLLLLPPFSSTWTPKGDHVGSNTDECTATLSYAVSLKKPGTVTFEYFYPDNSIYFEFFVSIARLHCADSSWDQTPTSFSLFAGSERPVSVHRVGEPLDEDHRQQLEQIRGWSPSHLA